MAPLEWVGVTLIAALAVLAFLRLRPQAHARPEQQAESGNSWIDIVKSWYFLHFLGNLGKDGNGLDSLRDIARFEDEEKLRKDELERRQAQIRRDTEEARTAAHRFQEERKPKPEPAPAERKAPTLTSEEEQEEAIHKKATRWTATAKDDEERQRIANWERDEIWKLRERRGRS